MKSWKFVSADELSSEAIKVYINPNQSILDQLPEWISSKDLEKEPFVFVESELGKVCLISTKESGYKKSEELRKHGFSLFGKLPTDGVVDLLLSGEGGQEVAEGLVLSYYSFDKYLSTPTHTVLKVSVAEANESDLYELISNLEAVYFARDLVNEPPNVLHANYYASELQRVGKEVGIDVEVLEEAKIESLKMGGLLAVNQGSEEPPTFTIMEWKPQKTVNDKPIIFVGKGVTYDTGGLSIKPTPNSMDFMKADMAGSAAVVGAIVAIAKNKLPIHVITLVPATDNRVGEKSFSPGDIIKMYSGATVEVLNTDAEGRLVLADALTYAKKYKPELVIDVATLTGAAARAIGKEGVVFMGEAPEKIKSSLKSAGESSYERLVEFPMWDEYDEQLKSTVADFTNLGGPEGGAITAGKFLQRFVDYNWLHLDIAGPSFLKAIDSYRGIGGTGVGVRLLYNFAKGLIKENGE